MNKEQAAGQTKEQPPLLYEERLDQILTTLETTKHSFLVCGGPGLGKTTIIEEMVRWRPATGKLPELLKERLEGRHGKDALKKLGKIVTKLENEPPDKHDPVHLTLIDDLDYFVEYLASMGSLRELEDLIITADSNENVVLLMTTTRSTNRWFETGAPRADIQPLTEGQWFDFVRSDVLQQAHHAVYLDPWEPGWEDRLESSVESEFKKPLENNATRRGEGSESAARDELGELEANIEEWASAILEVSGGHPSLVGASFAVLRELTSEASDTETTSFRNRVLSAKPEVRLSYLEERVGRSGFKVVRRTLEGLAGSDDPSLREAFELLVRLRGSGDVKDAPYHAREALTMLGLAYRDHTKEGMPITIPGSLLREEVSRLANSPRAAIRPAAHRTGITSPARLVIGPDKSGKLVAEGPTGPAEVAITGVLLELLRELDKRRGSVVKLADLERYTKKSEAAVKSGIRRLVTKLEGTAFDGAVENVYGEGYIFHREMVR